MPPTARNDALRRRIEIGIAIAAPLLDAGLLVADRLSRILSSDDPEHIAPQVRRDGGRAARGLPEYRRRAEQQVN